MLLGERAYSDNLMGGSADTEIMPSGLGSSEMRSSKAAKNTTTGSALKNGSADKKSP